MERRRHYNRNPWTYKGDGLEKASFFGEVILGGDRRGRQDDLLEPLRIGVVHFVEQQLGIRSTGVTASRQDRPHVQCHDGPLDIENGEDLPELKCQLYHNR